jgi:hypothetical protein
VDNVIVGRDVDAVQARLALRFPEFDVDVIAAAVRLAHSELTGGMRDFVPALVEHNARCRLAAIHAGTGPGQELAVATAELE